MSNKNMQSRVCKVARRSAFRLPNGRYGTEREFHCAWWAEFAASYGLFERERAFDESIEDPSTQLELFNDQSELCTLRE